MEEDDPHTLPVPEAYYETVSLHGRDFQTYALENGAYFAPVDEDEAERLAMMHDVFDRLFDGRVIFPPVQRLRRVLDCGAGSAHWAMDVAQLYPTCEVIGLDISPHMYPVDKPANLSLQVDDLNKPFTFHSNHFDLVHSQMMAGGIHANRWREYLREIHRVLRPGGWCQIVEIYFNVQSDNGSLTNHNALRLWSRRYLESIQPFKDPRAPLQLNQLVQNAGFVDIEHRVMPLPLCAWSTDARDHDIGTANRENVRRLLSSLAIYPFTENLGMSFADVQMLVAQARVEADNPAFKAYFPVYVCIGRKRQRP